MRSLKNNIVHQRSVLVLTAGLTALSLVHCAPEKPLIPGTMQQATLLSQMGVFTGRLAEQQPSDRGVMYSVNTPLFSDFTLKRRFVILPPGQQLTYSENEYWGLPVGAIVVKTFSYPVDARDPSLGERLIETRLLVQQQDGLHGFTFAWNAAQTDADYIADGLTVPVSWINEGGTMMQNNYRIPAQSQCRSCHQSHGKLSIIGLRTAQLDRDFDDGHGSMNQLQRFVERGFLPANTPVAGPHTRLVALDDPNASVELRARSYMDANCSHCHINGGYASEITTLRLRLVDTVASTPLQLGSCMRSKRSLDGRRYVVVPGMPDQSEMLTRLYAPNPFDHMPRSTNQFVHEDAVSVIRAWITALPAQQCPP